MKFHCLLLVCTFLLTSVFVPAQRIKPETRIIAQPAAPIKITSYSARYIGSGSTYVERGIHHELEYQNVSDKNVIAIEFGLVCFDIWNEFLDRQAVLT